MRRLALGALALAWVACENTEPAPSPSPGASASAASAADPSRQITQELRALSLKATGELERAFEKLERARKHGDRARALVAYTDLRRAYRRVEPIAGVYAPVAVSQLDPRRDDPDEAPTDIGLRALGDVLLEEPFDRALFDKIVNRTLAASRLPRAEISTANIPLRDAGVAMSRAIFAWGRRLDGSEAESVSELSADVLVSGRGLLEYCDVFLRHARRTNPSSAAQLAGASAAFKAWLAQQPPNAEPRDKLRGLKHSANLGAALRRVVVELSGEVLRPPFRPARPTTGDDYAEPVSVATFPAMPGAFPDVKLVELGAALFFDTRLSENGKLSCASCHQLSYALSAGPQRPRGFDGKLVKRDPPALWNTAFDRLHFWDGRAGTLERQIEIAVENDMGGKWDAIVERLRADSELSRRFAESFKDGVTARNVQRAIANFERGLVSDETPFDRFVRGDERALGPEQLRGFDIFYGRSRCSRCHRLPLTTGTSAPRFVESELSAIGVPLRPGSKQLDPDPGSSWSSRPQHDHAFKIPSLRNLAVTAPYFHNGAFKTIEEVVDFYETGSGKGLGIKLNSFDPDADEFEVTDAERRALIAFLRDGLRDQVTTPPP